jgi:hypothetical protein
MASQKSSAPEAASNDYPSDAKAPLNGTSSQAERSSPPPSYIQDAAIPDINAGFQNLNLAKGSCGSLPRPDHCIAHLKLLEAFQTLREDVGYKDGLFGISDNLASNFESTSSAKTTDTTDASLAKIREKRWAIYVARAAERFQAWWQHCVPKTSNGLPSRRLTQADLDSKQYEGYPNKGTSLTFSKDDLPPLGLHLLDCGRNNG